MDHPAKRLKISRPDSRSPRDAGSKMAEGLFTSELGSNSKDGAQILLPTRTLSFIDLQRRRVFDAYSEEQRPALIRRNPIAQLLPRFPDATVTASVVDVNIDVGTTTIEATEVAAATDATIVEVSSYGTLTVPGLSTTDSAAGSSTTDSSQDTLTPSVALPTDSSSPSSTDIPGAAASVLQSALTNSTTSDSTTVTVTATSTFEVSYVNGTFAVTAPFALASTTKAHSNGTGTLSTINSASTSNSQTNQLFPNESMFTGAATNMINGAAATGSPTGSAASSSSSSSGSGSSGPGLTPTQQQVVGGVVGGVAGIAVILLVALIFLRWYRKRLKSQGRLPEQSGQREITSSGGDSFNPMSERSSTVPLAAAMASFGRRLRPYSSNTVATTASGVSATTIPESERGFHRVAGRKIDPVLSSGGDGYGGNYGVFEKEPPLSSPSSSSFDPSTTRGLANSSPYRDTGRFYSGKSSSPSPITLNFSPAPYSRGPGNTKDFAADSPKINATKPEGFAVMRPSPARTPITQSPNQSTAKLPIEQGPVLEPEAPPTPALPLHLTRDVIGRSLASEDGSHVSRGSGTGSRFSERIS